MIPKPYKEKDKMKKKTSEILKAALAVCLVLGAALAMIACGTNNAQESSSGTSTAEAATTAPTIVEDPKKIIDKKQKSVLDILDLCEEQYKEKYQGDTSVDDIIGASKIIYLNRVNFEGGDENLHLAVQALNAGKGTLYVIHQAQLSQENFNYLADKFEIVDDKSIPFSINPIIRFSDDYSGDYEYILESTKHINEIEDEKILDIILNCFSKALAQDQQDGAAG